jgi:hypothetical protein
MKNQERNLRFKLKLTNREKVVKIHPSDLVGKHFHGYGGGLYTIMRYSDGLFSRTYERESKNSILNEEERFVYNLNHIIMNIEGGYWSFEDPGILLLLERIRRYMILNNISPNKPEEIKK